MQRRSLVHLGEPVGWDRISLICKGSFEQSGVGESGTLAYRRKSIWVYSVFVGVARGRLVYSVAARLRGLVRVGFKSAGAPG
jgi:hypothetical protein